MSFRLSSKLALALSLSLAASLAAVAAPERLTDGQYIAASRCLGILQSKSLGTPNAGVLAADLKTQSSGRPGYVLDKADEARGDTALAAGSAGSEERARLTAERDGVCQSFLPSASVAGSPTPAGS